MKCYSFDEIKSQANCLEIARELGLNPNNQGRCAATWRGGHNPNVAINKDGWFDHKDKNKGSVIDLVALVKFSGCMQQAQQWLGERLGLTAKHDTAKAKPRKAATRSDHLRAEGYTEVKRYDYTDAFGNAIHQVIRFEHPEKPKQFIQCAASGKESLDGIETVLYNLPMITKSKFAILVEGEKDADTLAALGLPATTNAGGAGAWRWSYTAALMGKDVVMLLDNDAAGLKRAYDIGRAIRAESASVKILTLSKLPKGDVTDWMQNEGGNKEKLLKAIAEAPKLSSREIAELAGKQAAGDVEPIGAGEWLSQPDEPDRPIIEGLFDECDRVAIVGQSKARKSFYALQLGVAIATGSEMLGSTPNAFKVLLVNGEISTHAYKKRLRNMIEGLQINAGLLDNLKVLNLSNSSEVTTFATVLDETVNQNCQVCIIDPVYLLITDELDQKEVKAAVLEMKKFSAEGITLISVYHSTKGKIGDRQGIDRISGSGILARDCSTLISLCEHASEPDHVVISAITRNYAPSEPITAKFSNGAFSLSDVAPVEANSRTRPKRHIPVEEAIKAFTEESICYGDAVKAVKKQCSCSDVPAKDLISEMTKKGMLFRMELGRRTMYSAIKRESV